MAALFQGPLKAAADTSGWSPEMAPAAGGRFERLDADASRHVAARRVDVWLPPGYDQANLRRHPVLYMHDGQNLFDPVSSTAGQPWAVGFHVAREMLAGRMRPAIVVGIWSTRHRYAEYAPAAAFGRMSAKVRSLAVKGGSLDGEEFQPLSDHYLRFLVEELKPAVDARYRTSTRPEDTAIAGSSMGGLISLYALASHPEVFGAAACLSTHWPVTVTPSLLRSPGDPRLGVMAAAFRDWLAENLPPAGRHRLYFDHGDQNLDALYAPHQQAVDRLLASLGYRQGMDVLSMAFEAADHNEPAWRSRLGPALRWMLPA